MQTELLIFTVFLVNLSTPWLIFWGYLMDGRSECQSLALLNSFDKCLAACEESKTCIVAEGNDSSCLICDLFVVNQIGSSGKEEGLKVAVKVDAESTPTCSDVFETNAYNGKNGYNSTFSFSFESGHWSVNYPVLSCQSGWKKFNRPTGQTCIKVSGGKSPVSRDDALKLCGAAGLAGIMSEEESAFIQSESKSLSGTLSQYDYTATWVSGIRHVSCNSNAADSIPHCQGITAFNVTDPFLSSTEFMESFVPGHPSAVVDRNVRRDCLQVFIGQQKQQYAAKIADAVCKFGCSENNKVCATTYACGQAAT